MGKILLLLLTLLMGCQGQSYEDFRDKGRSKIRSLLTELRRVRTKDQLIARELQLKEAFDHLSSLVEDVRQFRKEHPDLEPPPLTAQDKELSEELHLELLRVSRLDGGREILSRFR